MLLEHHLALLAVQDLRDERPVESGAPAASDRAKTPGEVLFRGRAAVFSRCDWVPSTPEEVSAAGEIERGMAALGYAPLGDFLASALPDVAMRGYARGSGMAYGVLLASSRSVQCEFHTMFGEGRFLTTTSARGIEDLPEKGVYRRSRPGASPEELHREHERGIEEFRLPDSSPDLAQPDLEALAKAIDSLLARFGSAVTGVSPDVAESPIDAILLRLGDRKTSVRSQARKALARLGGTAALPLARLLADADTRTRAEAAKALGELGPAAEPAAGALVRAIGDAKRHVAEAAEEALATLGPVATGALVEALDGAGAEVRMKIPYFLARCGPRGIEALFAALEHPDPIVRSQIPGALVMAGADPERSVPALAALYARGDVIGRSSAVSALGSFAPRAPQAIPTLLAALEDPEAAVRIAAMTSVSSVAPGDETFQVRLVASLDDEETRESALEMISAMGPPAVVLLRELMGHGDPAVRASAVEAFASFGEEAAGEAIPLLVEAIRDPSVQVRAAGIAGLANHLDGTEGPTALPAVLEALRDPAPAIREAASDALEFADVEADVLVPTLIQFLEDAGDEPTRQAMVGMLADRGSEVCPFLVELLGSSDPRSRLWAAWILGALGDEASEAASEVAALTGDADASVRLAALSALGGFRSGAAAALPALSAALADPDPRARQVAALALGDLGKVAEPAYDSLLALRKDASAAVRAAVVAALARFGAEAQVLVPELVFEALKDESPRVRMLAAVGLGELGAMAKPWEEALAALTEDPDQDVRTATARTLKQIGGKPSKKRKR
ncbi:MAG: HEAT repeat domain-containing protein [Planctomycetes bacterium]|nr:HEAT repeat domain-containing protein [Planctomycetota bacterium]